MGSQIELEIKYSTAQWEMFFENNEYKYKIFPKGRRLGATCGASQYFIQCMLDGIGPLLWGDVSYRNINLYIKKFWFPILERLPRNEWSFSPKAGQVRIRKQFCDFRSAKQPDTWEGFGYKKIFLNEAGIILKNAKLWDESVLPMAIDYPSTQVIVAGTPKGNTGKFPELWSKVLSKTKNYYGKQYSTYNNDFITREQIEDLESQYRTALHRQILYGEFVQVEGAMIKKEWIQYYDPDSEEFRDIRDSLRIVQGVDVARGATDAADYTAIVTLGVSDLTNKYYILDVERQRLTLQERKKFVIRKAEHWNPSSIGIENVFNQDDLPLELLNETGLPIKAIKSVVGEKSLRFEPISARYENKMIFHPNGTDKYKLLPEYFYDELLSFPDSEHDDMVDAFTHAFKLAKKREYKYISMKDLRPKDQGKIDLKNTEGIYGIVR
jgi:predicted phage terminase large subunit-like protein